MKVIWQAEMKVKSIEPPSEAGGPAVLNLALKGAMDGEAMGNVAMMMCAPLVRVVIEQLQSDMFLRSVLVDPNTGEVYEPLPTEEPGE